MLNKDLLDVPDTTFSSSPADSGIAIPYLGLATAPKKVFKALNATGGLSINIPL